MASVTSVENNNSTLPKFLGGLAAVIVFTAGVLLIGMLRGMAHDPPAHVDSRQKPNVNASHQGLILPQATDDYWQLTVAGLHNVRFDGIPDTQESYLDFVNRWLEQFQAALAIARATPTQYVDPELVAMVERHLKIDEAAIEIHKSYGKLMAKMAEAPEVQAGLQKHSIAELVVKGLEAAQRDDAPADVKEALITLRTQQESYGQMLHDIEIMQAKLQERYKRNQTGFRLPTIQLGVVKMRLP